jgi:hypothetical protein
MAVLVAEATAGLDLGDADATGAAGKAAAPLDSTETAGDAASGLSDPAVETARVKVENMIEHARNYAHAIRVLQRRLAEQRIKDGVVAAAGSAAPAIEPASRPIAYDPGLSADQARLRSLELAALLDGSAASIANVAPGRLRLAVPD